MRYRADENRVKSDEGSILTPHSLLIQLSEHLFTLLAPNNSATKQCAEPLSTNVVCPHLVLSPVLQCAATSTVKGNPESLLWSFRVAGKGSEWVR